MTEIRQEPQGLSDWGNIFLEYHEKEYRFPYHIPSGEVFNYDPTLLIRFKCVGLVAMTPLVSLIRSVYWFAVSIFMVLSEVYRYLDGQSPSEEAQEAIYANAYDSLRALGYGTLMTGSALMGIFAPYQGRLHYGLFERELNHHSDGPHRDKFYMAICFQRLTNLSSEDEDEDQVEDKLTRYLDRIDSIRTAVWACSLQQLTAALSGKRPVET
jgi:hypothetical protein